MIEENNYTLHIIRDVFGRKISPIYYGKDVSILNDCYSSMHSMGCEGFYSDAPFVFHEKFHYLNVDKEDVDYFLDHADFLFSIDYKYELDPPYCDRVAKKFKKLLKDQAQIFLVNPGTWSYCFDDYYERNFSLEREVKKFSLFKDEKVFVYENI